MTRVIGCLVFFLGYHDLDEEENNGKRKKLRIDTGEIDIFAISKDKKEYLFIKLKNTNLIKQLNNLHSPISRCSCPIFYLVS